MARVNNILPFSQGGGANVLSQADYLADAQRVTGNQTGTARAPLVNKAALQASAIAAGVAQFLADNNPAASDVTDALSAADIAAMFIASLGVLVVPRITANTTWYVRTDGNDNNTGLVDSAGGAFATLQHAWDVAQSYSNPHDQFTLTIHMGNGPWTTANGGDLVAIGPNFVSIVGDTAVPANVTMTSTGINIYAYHAHFSLAGVKLISTAAGYKGNITADEGANVNIGLNVEFGANANGCHMQAFQGGQFKIQSNYKISGSALNHVQLSTSGTQLSGQGITLTLTGTPAFSQFLNMGVGASFSISGWTFTGSATGTRYLVELNAVASTSGSTLPGSVAGSTATGGQYA